MTNLIKKLTSAISRTVLFVAGCIIAALSLMFVSGFALFALLVAGVALIASPFVALLHPEPVDAQLSR